MKPANAVPRATATTLLTAAMLAVVLAAAPPAAAQFGACDAFLPQEYAASTPTYALHFVDDDADGAPGLGEPIYWAVGSTLGSTDVRLTATAGRAAGTWVEPSHPDYGNALTPVPGAPAFFDADGDGAWSEGDTLLWSATGTAGAGDVVLSGTGVGKVVDGSSPFSNAALASTTAPTRVHDEGTYGADPSDILYLDMDGDGFGTVGDVRQSGSPLGHVLVPSDKEAAYRYESSSDAWTLNFVDDDGSGDPGPREPVYLVAEAPTTLPNLAVRIANTGSFAKGSQVLASHADAGSPIVPLPGVISYLDGGISFMGQPILADVDGSGTVSAGDVRISGPGAGEVVAAGDADVGGSLTPLAPFGIKVFDVDGDEVYSAGDEVFLDADRNHRATVHDVPLAGPGFGRGLTSADSETARHGTGGQFQPRCRGDIDRDDDRFPDDGDVCPTIYDPGQEDSDGDGLGDACDDSDDRPVDKDGDGVPDDVDGYPDDPARASGRDADGDGTDDEFDPDDDNDGTPDAQDPCPRTAVCDPEDGNATKPPTPEDEGPERASGEATNATAASPDDPEAEQANQARTSSSGGVSLQNPWVVASLWTVLAGVVAFLIVSFWRRK